MQNKNYTYLPYLAWIVALVSMLGSLYFSEIRHFPPCILCWYQRIVIYPMVLILLVGIIRKDKGLPYYILPLSIIGLLISIYHNLLYYKILPESAAPCTAGVSCTTQFVQYFGFITIPLLSLASLSIITLLMLLYLNKSKADIQ